MFWLRRSVKYASCLRRRLLI